MERISGYQLCMIGCILPSVIKMTILVPQIMDMARQHVYLPFWFAAIIVVFFIWIATKVSERFSGQDWFNILINRWPVFGRLLVVFYLLLFLYLLARDLHILTHFTNVYLLHYTPIMAIAILFIIPVVFMARGGIEIISRMAEIFTPILFFLGLFLPLMMVKDISVEYFRPLFDVQWKGVALSTWYVLPFTSEAMLLPFLAQNVKFKFKYGFIGLLVATLLVSIVLILILLTIGVHLSSKMVYPTYELVRLIHITDFLDRFELPLISLYYPSTMIKMAVSVYLLSHGLHSMMPNRASAKVLAAPFGLLGVACSFWFYNNSMELIQFNGYQPIFVLPLLLILPIFYYFFLHPKKEKASSEKM